VQKASGLEVNLKRLEGDLVESSARVGHLLEQERVLQDRCREQVCRDFFQMYPFGVFTCSRNVNCSLQMVP